VVLLYGHLKLQRLLKTKNTHMVTLDLYLHATPLISIYAYIAKYTMLLVFMLVVKHNLYLFSCNASFLQLFFFLVFLSGHGKFETLGALGISCMLLATAGGIAWHALQLLLVDCFLSLSLSLSLPTLIQI
jgi:hypothetical protein